MSKINHSQNEQISQNENKQSIQIITPEEEKNNHIFGKDSKNQLDDDDFMLSIPKKSFDHFPKNMEIEDPNSTIIKRKYTMEVENSASIKNFVPRLKPIEIHIIPSKLRLNKKGFKDLKRNKDNKILLNINKYYISCPEDEESDKNCSSKELSPFSNKKNENISTEKIKFTRKVLEQTKNENNMHKVNSINSFLRKNKYESELNLGYSSGSNLYEIDELDNDSLAENKEEVESNNNHRNRFNSWSILDILQKKYILED
jgi:hypothetical protein